MSNLIFSCNISIGSSGLLSMSITSPFFTLKLGLTIFLLTVTNLSSKYSWISVLERSSHTSTKYLSTLISGKSKSVSSKSTMY